MSNVQNKKASPNNLSRLPDIVINQSSSGKMVQWVPSMDQIKNFSEESCTDHRLETIIYSVSSDSGKIESLTFAFPQYEAPPQGTYTDGPTRPLTVP